MYYIICEQYSMKISLYDYFNYMTNTLRDVIQHKFVNLIQMECKIIYCIFTLITLVLYRNIYEKNLSRVEGAFAW